MIRRRNRRVLSLFTVLVTLAGAHTGLAQRGSAAPRPAGAPKPATKPATKPAPKPATVRAPQGETVSGISCDAMEGARMHTHQHLVLIDHGKELTIPDNVGQRPDRNCLYWIHTHTADGIIHIEAPQPRTFTLGDFFTIWGQPLDRTQAATMRAAKGEGGSLKVWVNGQPYTGDPRAIPLLVHADIVIEAGPPFIPPPKFTNWGTL
ncbi:MAG TPA: hypothetical protein VL524_14795 [Gemmatimonadaceae bacterium]|nr:hypothetical protein [Gemmatimonadaceae bacterium]